MNIIKQNKPLFAIFGGVLGGFLLYKLIIGSTQQSSNSNKNQEPKPPVDNWPNTIDPSSLSNIDDFTTKEYNMELLIDFKQKKLIGKITYSLEILQSNVSTLSFDIKCLKIKQVFDEETEQELQFKTTSLPVHQENLGDTLDISLSTPLQKGQIYRISVTYETDNPDNQPSAINWLEPEQTLGKKQPYMFTQSQPIFSRSIFPCQDSPAVKSTFQATLTVNNKLSAYCTGKLISSSKLGNQSVFIFDQTIPIPSYLFAIVSGNLESRDVSDRCSIITEPEFIEKSTNELVDMEKQLQTIEEYLTPYVWREYKIVLLPPSFPYGGMENPLLTFASPSIIVGDKSQVSVVIHEMVHSWSGNLVSCKNWVHFFLNEGLTVFIEHKVNQKIYGNDMFNMLNKSRDQGMRVSIDGYGHDHTYTSLQPNLEHNNPDDAFSPIPYVKGCQFFMFLEKQLGDKSHLFQEFLKTYFTHFAEKSLDYEEFLAFFKDFFSKKLGKQEFETYINSIDFQKWIFDTGLPPQVFTFESEGINKATALAKSFVTNPSSFLESQTEEFNNLDSQLKSIFLNYLKENIKDIPDSKQNIINFGEKLNMQQYLFYYDISVKWICIQIITQNVPEFDTLDQYLGSIGRMKYIRPIYKALKANDLSQLGEDLYKKHKNFYHTIASKMIGKDLGL